MGKDQLGTEEYQRILATGREDLISEYQQSHGGLEIRRIQALLLLASCLSPESDLGRTLGYALALPSEPWLSRVTPITDTSFTGIKTWLESLWSQEDLSPGERKLVDWQNSVKNITAAMRELKEIEDKVGEKLAAQIVQ
jgi:hypothetical protein